MTSRQETLRAIRQTGYQRNMQAMQDFKARHACSRCGEKYPHYVMTFAAPADSDWPIARLAGSRCSPDVLQAAMEKTGVLCANCAALREHTR